MDVNNQARAGCGRRSRTTRAFTLIELLVVVAIIGLLISILLPGLRAAREQTRSVKCLSNLRSIGIGIMTYTMEHRDTLPGPIHPPIYRNTGRPADGGNTYDCFTVLSETDANWFLLARLSPLLTNFSTRIYDLADELGTCPTAKALFDDDKFCSGQNGNPTWSRPFNYLPNSWDNTDRQYYFGWTNIGVTWTGWANQVASDPAKREWIPKQLSHIKRPSEEWAIADAWWQVKVTFVTPIVQRRTALGPWQLGNAPWLDPPIQPNPSAVSMSHNSLPREPYHANGRGTNILYFDGHGGQFVGIDEWAEKFPINRRER